MRFKVNFDKILADWPMKIVCFVVAILLYVLHDITMLQQKVITLPLTVIENGSMVVAGPYLSRVKVTIRGNGSDINMLGDNDISVYLDLSYYSEPGTFNIPVTTNKSQLAQAMTPLEINVEPKEIPLVLESRTFADVPVKAGLEGAPSDGYEVTNVTLQPSTLRIEGGSSIVASVTNLVTKPIPLDGRTESFDIMVATESVSQYIALPDKSSVKASVTIEPVEETKQFQTSITVRNLRSGLKIDSVLPLIDITVKGAQKSLERYSPSADAVYMDFSKITKGGTYDLPVIFSLPSYLELIAPTEKQTVSVVIKDSAVSQKVPAENKQAAEADNLPSTDGELTVTMTPVPAQEQ